MRSGEDVWKMYVEDTVDGAFIYDSHMYLFYWILCMPHTKNLPNVYRLG